MHLIRKHVDRLFIEIVTKIDVVMVMFEFVIDELSLNFEYSFLHF